MSSGPSVPDANSVSQAQTQSNKDTATAQTGLNATNQITPFGNLNYSQIGTWPDGTPRFQAETTLSPQLQGLFNTGIGTQQSIANTAQNMAGQLPGQVQSLSMPQYQQYGGGPQFNTQGGQIGNIQTNPGNAGAIQNSIGGDFDAVRQQTLDSLNSQLDERSGRDLSSLQQQLANQGIQPGSEAYRNAVGDYQKGLSANRTNAILAANTAQGQAQQMALNSGNFNNAAQQQLYGQLYGNANLNNAAQQQTYSQTLGNAGFNNQAQQQQYQNALGAQQLNNGLQGQRFQDQITGNNQNINQLLALLGGSQINSQPQFAQTPQTGINGTDVAGNAWNSYNAQQNQSNQFWNGLGAVGSAVGGALPFFLSDERAKTDIRDTGMKTPGGIPIKDWRYKGSPMMMRGYVAQDVQKRQPEAVARIKTPDAPKGGFLAVDYRRVA